MTNVGSSTVNSISNEYYTSNYIIDNTTIWFGDPLDNVYSNSSDPYGWNTIRIKYTKDADGLYEYIVMSDDLPKICFYMEDLYNNEDITDQEFYDSWFRNILDLIYEVIPSDMFGNLLDEKKYPLRELLKLSDSIFKDFDNFIKSGDFKYFFKNSLLV